jgi:hypothetical protein
VLFNWHAPGLWRRFTIGLRRALARHLRALGVEPAGVRVSLVKVAEYQRRRAIVHYHALIRLDPVEDAAAAAESSPPVSAADLARRVAGYLAKYTTKSRRYSTSVGPARDQPRGQPDYQTC